MKRVQMKLSFGMIFSIFLIIIFIVFAFYAINKFLNISRNAQIGTFVNDLQKDVNNIWKNEGSVGKEYPLPNIVKRICFMDNEFNNLRIDLKDAFREENIEHLDILKITEEKDPYCIENIDGKVRLIISREKEDLVTIS